MTLSSDVQALLDNLDGSGSDSERDAVRELRKQSNWPELLLAKYKRSRHWNERVACVFYAMRSAHDNAAAFELGLSALGDRSGVVRYRATMLLAYAQNIDAVGPLKELLDRGLSVEDARAAIDAIESKNHNFFVDRMHSGKIKMNIVEAR